MSSKPWLRLDVDKSVALKRKNLGMALNALRMKTGVPAPFFLAHVRDTKELLSRYKVQRVWFFRDFTCPDEFDEPFGIHITRPEMVNEEIRGIRKKLGDFSLFTRHGIARWKSGRLWTDKEISFVEEEYGLKDMSSLPHITVSRWDGEEMPRNIDHVLFHPCYIYIHRERLIDILDILRERNYIFEELEE